MNRKPIQVLSNELANMISAGEVVEKHNLTVKRITYCDPFSFCDILFSFLYVITIYLLTSPLTAAIRVGG